MVSGCGGMRPHLAGAIGGAGPRICHSEERSDVGISCNSPRIRRGFLVIQLSTARLPRPLRGLAMTNLRTGAVGGAISGRHCPSERAIVKTATAPDLSLRGGAADVAISGRHCRSEQAIVKTATAPDLSLRGGAADVAISGRHFQFVQGTDKNVPTNCVCSGAHCAAVGGFAALRMRRAPCG